MFDVFFLSYNESNAARNLKLLKQHCKPIHVSGVAGLFEAHRACAVQSKTEWFFVVDADSILIPNNDDDYFDFSTNFELNDIFAYVWDAKNPVNGLVYGYGGIKLFNKKHFSKKPIEYVDMSSTVAALRETKKCISETRFNSSPFDAWKAGFRETAKLVKHNILLQYQPNVEKFLKINEGKIKHWMRVGVNAEYGNFCIHGAKLGFEYANAYGSIQAINNYSWLKSYFEYSTKRDNLQ